MIFGALNTQSGTRLFLERKKQRQGDFQEFLGLIHERYRGWQVSLVLDGDSSHIAKMSRRMARILGIGLVWLPVRCPDLNALDHLWAMGRSKCVPIGSTDRLKNKCIISSIIWRDCPWRRHSGKREYSQRITG